MPIPDKSVGINNHKCKLRPDQWPNKSYGEANAEREVKRGGRRVELNRDKKIGGWGGWGGAGRGGNERKRKKEGATEANVRINANQE